MSRAAVPAALGVVVAVAVSACGGSAPGQDAARTACAAYADTGRRQVTTTVADTEALRAKARREAGRAAAMDDTWTALERDIDAAFSRSRSLADAHNAGQLVDAGDLQGYFAADRSVAADCQAAGEDIGPLRP